MDVLWGNALLIQNALSVAMKGLHLFAIRTSLINLLGQWSGSSPGKDWVWQFFSLEKSSNLTYFPTHCNIFICSLPSSEVTKQLREQVKKKKKKKGNKPKANLLLTKFWKNILTERFTETLSLKIDFVLL